MFSHCKAYLTGEVTELTGQITELTGQITELTGQITELTGQTTELIGQIIGVQAADSVNSGMFTKVPGCYITTLYYTGFSLMMSKR
jgi:TolA-binding protein